jgi:hypothetical protein
MKKHGIKTIWAIVLTAVLLFALAACGGSGGGDGNKPIDKIDFGKAGISGNFTAQVSGDLKTSRETEKGVELKWEKSNEQSFNNVIAWLKDGGYDKYDGADAVKESHPNGSYTMYCSDKAVSGALYEATSIFFHKDTNLASLTTLSASGSFGIVPLAAAPMAQEVNFKANDLYVMIEPVDDGDPYEPPVITSWPTAQIAGVLGANRLPVYAGTASAFEFSSNTTVGVTTLTVTVNGAGESDEQAYKDLLVSSGYALESGMYKKSFGADSVSVAVIGVGDKITVTATFSAALEGAWPASQLSAAFSGSGITVPSYDGASGFDFSNTFGVVIIKASNATGGITAYETKLVNAGFTSVSDHQYQKNANNDKILNINISDASAAFAGQVWLTITLEDKAAAPVSHYTLPQNVKIVMSVSGMTNTVIKIGDDYYSSVMGGMMRHYYKHNDGTWTHYTSTYGGSWEVEDTYNATQMLYQIEGTNLFGYMTEDYTDADTTNQGTATVAGVTVSIESYELLPGSPQYDTTYYIQETTGLVFKMTGMISFEVTAWDTTATSFDDIQLPA